MIKLSDIEQEYLRSFTPDHGGTPTDPKRTGSARKASSFSSTIKKGALSIDAIIPIDDRQQAEIAFSEILPHAKKLQKKLAQEQEPVLDQYSWQDLNLIAGNTTTPGKSALSHIKKTETAMGSAVMATQIVNPTTQPEEIISTQKVTQELLEQEAIAQEIDISLQTIQKNEALGLSLWQSDHHLNHQEYKKELDGYYYRRFGLNKRNNTTWLLQLKKIWKDLWLHPILGVSTITCLLYTLFWGFTDPAYQLAAYLAKGKVSFLQYQFLLSKIDHSIGTHLAFFFLGDTIFPFVSLFTMHETITPNSPTGVKKVIGFRYYYDFLQSDTDIYTKITFFTVVIGKILLGSYFVYRAYKKYRRNRSVLHFLASHLIPLQDLVIQAGKISYIIARNPVLEKYYSQHLTATRSLLTSSEDPQDEESLLIHHLQKVQLHQPSYFFSNTGRLLATYKLFQEKKAILADIYYEMGLVDVQLSIYKLMKVSREKHNQNRFVFGNIEKESKGLPTLTMKGMWHFGLDPGKAISNDVTMKSVEGPRTTIITGPNAGGKSTYILGTALSAILNQVYGIVAAESATQTIFYKMITYVNPVQNLAAGLSLAEAGMEVLKTHKNILDKVKKPILAIIDEMLNGTDPKVAAEYSSKILEHRHQHYPNCLTLLTTHLMHLTKMAKKDHLVKNKKVVLTIPGQHGKKFDYTYQIADGITDQNIVEDMLTEKGIL